MPSGRACSAHRVRRHQPVTPERVVAFYNHRGTAEQWIKEGKNAINWTRLSCRSFAANAVRLQLHALAYNLGNFLRTLATPEPIRDWSLTSLKEKLIKIGDKFQRASSRQPHLTPLALGGTVWMSVPMALRVAPHPRQCSEAR